MFSMFDFLVQRAAGCRQPVLMRHGSSQSVKQIEMPAWTRLLPRCTTLPSVVTLEPDGESCHFAHRPKDDEHAVAPEASRGMVEGCVPSVLGRGYVPRDIALSRLVCVRACPVCLVGRGSSMQYAASSTRDIRWMQA